MIFDTDILSMLGKIGRADLLRKLFPEESLVITFDVYNEPVKIAKPINLLIQQKWSGRQILSLK